jgi:arylsulfatase A-like enzyme
MQKKMSMYNFRSCSGLLGLLLLLLLVSGCRRTEMRHEPLVPEKIEGITCLNMASLKDDALLSGAFKPPILGNDGVFRRKLRAPGGRVRFFMPAKEDVVVRVAASGGNGLQLKLGNRTISLQKADTQEVFNADSCQQGENVLELLLPAGETMVQQLEIYPRRFMRLPNFRAMIADPLNVFLPTKLRYVIKPLADEELWLQLSWKQGKRLEFALQLLGEKQTSSMKLQVESGKAFSVPLLKAEYQQVILTSTENRQGMLHLDLSELRRPVPQLDKAELQEKAKGKNVVFLLLDAARPDRLQILGNKRAVAPNIDQFAREGITFANANCEAPYTVASSGTLLTGLPAEFHGVTYSFNHTLGSNFVTLAEMFKTKGYYTASATANSNYSSAFRYNRGFDRFEELYKENPNVQAPDFLTSFAKYMDEAQRQKKPFFIYLHMLEPHMSYNMPKPFIGKFQKRFVEQCDEFQRLTAETSAGKNITPEAVALNRDAYDENYNYGDSVIGSLLDRLKAMKLYDDTIIIVLSDHGEAFAEHGIMGHNVIWFNEAIKCLQVWRFPGFEARIERKPMLTSDLLVTLSDAFALPYTFRPYSSGENIFALPAERRRLARCLQTLQGYPGFVIEQYPYKLALYFPYDERKIELYDLAGDPGEKHNIYIPGNMPGQALLFYLRSHLYRAATVPRVAARPNLSEQDLKNLKALGYINE